MIYESSSMYVRPRLLFNVVSAFPYRQPVSLKALFVLSIVVLVEPTQALLI